VACNAFDSIRVVSFVPIKSTYIHTISVAFTLTLSLCLSFSLSLKHIHTPHSHTHLYIHTLTVTYTHKHTLHTHVRTYQYISFLVLTGHREHALHRRRRVSYVLTPLHIYPAFFSLSMPLFRSLLALVGRLRTRFTPSATTRKCGNGTWADSRYQRYVVSHLL
jgi:hypothetical protein